MQTRRDKLGDGMTPKPPLERCVTVDHRPRKLNRVLNLSFVHEAACDRYCQENSRLSIGPAVLLRLLIRLQAFAGIRAVRGMGSGARVNGAWWR